MILAQKRLALAWVVGSHHCPRCSPSLPGPLVGVRQPHWPLGLSPGSFFYAFDLLHFDSENLRERPLIERRAKLKALLGTNETSALQYSDEFTGDSAAFFRAFAEHGLEGIGLQTGILPLSQWTQQDVAQVQMLH